MKKAIFFLITTRSGTQNLSSAISNVYKNEVKCVHDFGVSPIEDGLARGRLLYEDSEKWITQKVINNVSEILNTLKEKNYILCTHNGSWFIPYFIDAIGKDNVKLVHVSRCPVHWFYSISKMNLKLQLRNKLRKDGLFYNEKYKNIIDNQNSDYMEKATLLWNEFHDYAEDVIEKYQVPNIFFRTEELWVNESKVKELIEFCELTYKDVFFENVKKNKDRYKNKKPSNEKFKFNLFDKHLEIKQKAKRYGYSLDCKSKNDCINKHK